ncbi:NEAT domain-containing protein [Sporosarcina sp. Marseille-Q4063]|uniref:NEAT domain-containing protein n=1 Tax=Sporosarcina sp. Marseille-Q4063 TaxID=2810514 RepID=UPI001BAF1972|nr:NEAT domain-containing protein [Sporosarcina sp. Marseille-Q4063]QUW21367.1 NEAT domain-containing protein [Sporosarcina sp. Marseille-Q4063]
MRNKWILPILMMLLALPFFSSAVFAEETVVYEDGEYDVLLEVKHATEDKLSTAGGYLTNPKVIVKDGNITYVQLELTSSSMIKSLKVPSGEVDLISEDLEENTRVVGFKVEGDLTEPVQMKMHVVVPPSLMPPNGYDTTHTVRAFFDVSKVPTKAGVVVEEEPTKPEEKPTEPEEEDKQADLSNLKDGYYTVNVSYLRDDNDDASTMGNYLEGKLFLAISKGKAEVTATVKKDGTVTLLQLNGKNAVEKKVEGEKRHESFEFDQLQSQLNAYVEYQAPMGPGKMHYGKANFRIVLNEDSITVTDASNKPGANVEAPGDNDEPEEIEKPGDTEVPGEKDTQKPGDTDKSDENPAVEDNKDNNEPQTPEKKNQLKPDKAYEIGFVIKHETEDKASSANSFFKGPAILLEKDGERYIQITVTGKEYIDWLKNKFGEMVVVKEDKDSIVYQFKLDGALPEAILLDMQITVPGFYDGRVHKARLFLDESSLKEVDANKYTLVASNNENGPKVPGAPVKKDSLEEKETVIAPPTKTNNNDPTIEKPKLDSKEKNGSTNETKVTGQEKNPQTGDTTNILLYVVLLIGSAIPLAVMAKRRFANVA